MMNSFLMRQLCRLSSTATAARAQSAHAVYRNLHSSVYTCESALGTLRKKTGLAFTLCKQALQQNDNDLAKAEQWLKAEAAKHGWEKSVKLQNRNANEGLIGVYISECRSTSVLVEVNCETDFVSKNSKFRELVSNLTKEIANAGHLETSSSSASNNTQSLIKKYSIDENQLIAFKDAVSEAVTQLGEKIRLSRAMILKSHAPADQQLQFIGYTHSTAGSNLLQNGVLLGKYASIVAVRQLLPTDPTLSQVEALKSQQAAPEQTLAQDEDEDFEQEQPVSLEEATKNLCQHIIGMKPKQLTASSPSTSATDDLSSANQTNADQASAEQQTNQDSEPKPKHFAYTRQEVPESDALLEQKFLLDDDKTVAEYLNFNRVHIADFVRVECGETSQVSEEE